MMKDYIGADRMAKCRHSSACYCETVPNVSLKSAGCLSSQQAVCQVQRPTARKCQRSPQRQLPVPRVSEPAFHDTVSEIVVRGTFYTPPFSELLYFLV